MQKNYFLKALFSFLFSSLFTFSYAADWYISTTGNDTSGDGLTPATAWASFSKAQNAAVASSDPIQIIHVAGLIDFSIDPGLVQPTGVAIAKNLTVQGTSSVTDGFDGKGLTRFFSNTTFTLVLKNLKLVNGYCGNNNGGAIINTSTGTLNCENVVFDGNKTQMSASTKTGAAIHFDNATGSIFKNCVFSNNEASKAGAIYITAWVSSTTILFEGCSFVGNIAKESFGGSAVLIRANTSTNATCNFVNCTFKGNLVNTAANGGAIYFGNKSLQSTNVNIINCTISENKTAGSSTNGAGVVFLNTAGATACIGNLYIQNSIIENNTTNTGAYSDLFVSAVSPATAGGGSATVPGFIKVQNSIIGAVTSDPLRVPAATNIIASPSYNYLTVNSAPGDFVAGLAPFNTSNNTYPLYVGSPATTYGASTYLTSLSPSVTTDQLNNVRTVGATNYAGAVEVTVATTTPDAPTTLVATAGDAQISVTFKSGKNGGSAITNYLYSIDGTNYTACSPAQTSGPIVINGLNNYTAYTVKIKAVNVNGESVESVASNSVTPSGVTGINNLTNGFKVIKSANNRLVVTNITQKTGVVTVCNAMGQRIISSELNASTTTIDREFVSGVYIVTLNIEGRKQSTKIIL